MRLDPYIVVYAAPERPSAAAVVLRGGGYQVTRLTDAENAIDDVAVLRPDAVVIDLPPMKAMRTVNELAKIAPSLPVLIVTAAPSLVQGETIRPSNVMADLVCAVDRLIVESLKVA